MPEYDQSAFEKRGVVTIVLPFTFRDYGIPGLTEEQFVERIRVAAMSCLDSLVRNVEFHTERAIDVKVESI